MNHSLLKRDTQQCGSPAICTQLNGPWLADFWESQCSFLSQGSWPDPTSAGRVHEVYMIHVQVWQPGRRPKLCPTGTAISAETTARLAHISIAASSQTVKKYYSTTAHQTLSHEELCKSNGPRRWSTQFSAAKNSVQHRRKSLKRPFVPD